MTKSWKNGTAPETSDKVHDFVHRHVHENFLIGSNNRRHVPKPEIMCGVQEPQPLRYHHTTPLTKNARTKGAAVFFFGRCW